MYLLINGYCITEDGITTLTSAEYDELKKQIDEEED
tara:strand:+ start:482 stop:589 length:108 start_codon:yes stop_codon:yes gene_type:complete